MKKFFKIICIFLVCLCLFLMILKPETYIKSALYGIKLWALTVVPSLLPFFFFTSLLSVLGVTSILSKTLKTPCKILFKTSGVSGYDFLMSVLSGYPVGAKIIADLYENKIIDSDEATKISTFCSTSGPLFVIGSVGYGMFSNKTVGYTLIISHILSAILCGIVFRFYGNKNSERPFCTPTQNDENALYNCVYSSVISVACVGGFICVFGLFLDVFQNLNLLLPLVKLLNPILGKDLSSAFCYGLIEITKGCKSLSVRSLSPLSVSLSSSLISFGGFSVWAQSSIFLSRARVNLKIFFISKILQTVFSFFIAYGLCLLFNFC